LKIIGENRRQKAEKGDFLFRLTAVKGVSF